MDRRTTWLGSAALAAVSVSAASCGGSVETNLWNDGGAGTTSVTTTTGSGNAGGATGGTGGNTGGTGGDTGGTGGDTGGTGGGPACTPGSAKPCYTGPAGTENIGLCAAGTATCNADGAAWGPCTGEITPAPESCVTAGDDDCDGKVNEGCACAPGATKACYSGPAGTVGVGVCKAGVQTCNADGSAYGPCAGEVLPGVEDCKTAADENCDGKTPPCGDNEPIIDLRADVNRNGTIDLTDPTEDEGEDAWGQARGAIFLANIDDDQKSCPTGSSQTDAQLAACNDAADEVINGAADLADLARLRTVPWPGAPADASATISVSAPGASYVRLFKNSGGTFSVFDPATKEITAAELAAGVELAIEGKDIVRDSAVWNGKVKISLHVHAGTGPDGPLPDGSDTVEMRLSPVMFRHHLDAAETVYASKITNSTSSATFRADLSAAMQAAGVPNPLREITVSDQWNQDYFETAYMSMPAPGGGQKVIHVNFRSAYYTSGGLRSAGRTVYTVLRGSDVAGATVYDSSHSNSMDTLNSFGNLETIPPFTKGSTTFPLGKVIRGSAPTWYPDPAFDKMITSQSVQGILYVDTSWLLVGHIDETTSFVRAPTARGWALMVGDSTLGRTLLEQAKAQGFGSTPMFVGKYWSGNSPAEVTIDEVLADTEVMNESAWAAVQTDNQVAAIKAETGLTDAELIKVASLWEQASGSSVAYVPGMVNGIYLSDTDFGPPDPHGPVIGGQDLWKAQLEGALLPYGINVRWIEDWDLYHRLDGEVHCGSNTTRAVPANIKWWESGL